MLLWQNSIWREQKVKKLVSPRKQFTQLLKVYASFFFLCCIIPRLYPGMPLFRSGPEFRRERVLKLINSCSKFAWAFIFLYQLFSLPWKKRCFVTLKKPVLETQMTSNQKFSADPTGEVLQPTNTLQLKLWQKGVEYCCLCPGYFIISCMTDPMKQGSSYLF